MVKHEELKSIFEKYDDEYIRFEKVKNKTSKKRDIHAFMLLDKLTTNKYGKILGDARHDVVFLFVNCKDLSKVITEKQILELVRCGVMYSEKEDCLTMYV